MNGQTLESRSRRAIEFWFGQMAALKEQGNPTGNTELSMLTKQLVTMMSAQIYQQTQLLHQFTLGPNTGALLVATKRRAESVVSHYSTSPDQNSARHSGGRVLSNASDYNTGTANSMEPRRKTYGCLYTVWTGCLKFIKNKWLMMLSMYSISSLQSADEDNEMLVWSWSKSDDRILDWIQKDDPAEVRKKNIISCNSKNWSEAMECGKRIVPGICFEQIDLNTTFGFAWQKFCPFTYRIPGRSLWGTTSALRVESVDNFWTRYTR